MASKISKNEKDKKTNLNESISFNILRQPTESLLWLTIWYSIGGYIYLKYRYQPYNLLIFIQYNYFLFLSAFAVVFIPIIFKQIFGSFPVSYLAKKLDLYDSNVKKDDLKKDLLQLDSYDYSSPEESLFQFFKDAKNISGKIYGRSNSHLLSGILIAFAGIAIFLSPLPQNQININLTDKDIDIWDKLLISSPRFGSLFFIEFIAFFFLKQYRITMEEFRYYEGLTRRAQRNMLAYQVIKENILEQDIIDKYFKYSELNETRQYMSSGQTTEILETHKIVNQEFDLIDKAKNLGEKINKVVPSPVQAVQKVVKRKKEQKTGS